MQVSLLASTTLLLWKALEDIGIDNEALFVKVGLNPENLMDANSRYPYANVRQLWEQSILLSKDPCLGLRMAKYWHPSDFHALGYAWLVSETLKEALLRASRYFRIVSTDPEELRLEENSDGYRFVIDNSNVKQRAMDEEYDVIVTLIVDMCRISSRSDIDPLRIELQRPRPACAKDFEEYFRCSVVFSAEQNVIYFPKNEIEKPLPTANPEILIASDKIITDYLARLNRQDIVVQVKSKLIDQLSSGNATQKTIAGLLHMSVRSLQRRLRLEGTTFKNLLEQTRKELAEEYIMSSTFSINEITFMLGFSEPANFTRAFKRWTGLPPSEYRHTH